MQFGGALDEIVHSRVDLRRDLFARRVQSRGRDRRAVLMSRQRIAALSCGLTLLNIGLAAVGVAVAGGAF